MLVIKAEDELWEKEWFPILWENACDGCVFGGKKGENVMKKWIWKIADSVFFFFFFFLNWKAAAAMTLRWPIGQWKNPSFSCAFLSHSHIYTQLGCYLLWLVTTTKQKTKISSFLFLKKNLFAILIERW